MPRKTLHARASLPGLDIWALFPLLISLANTYGLMLVVLLIGYGCAEVPRALWAAAAPEASLRRLCFSAPDLEGKLFDTKAELSDIVGQVRAAAAKVAALESAPAFASGEGAKELLELRRCLAVVQAKAVVDASASHAYNPHGAAGRGGGDDDDDGAGGTTAGWCGRRRASRLSDARRLIRRLAALHKALMAKRALLAKTQFRWDRLVHQSVELDHVVAGRVPPRPPAAARARGASQYWGTVGDGGDDDAAGGGGAAPPNAAVAAVLRSMSCLPDACGGAAHTALWRWKIHAAPTVYVILAMLAEAMSLLLSECERRGAQRGS